MDEKKTIRLIATDVDGTLVKESSPKLYSELIEAIRILMDNGVTFVVASGRQYGSLRKLFADVNRPLNCIAENGAHIILEGKNYSVTKMERSLVEGIMADLRELYKEDCHVVASTSSGCYLESKDAEFIDLIENSYRNDVNLTEDILSVDAEFLKLAVYKKGGIRELGESILIPKWKDVVKTTMAGEDWVDFMDPSVDKGHALKTIQEALKIDRTQTMVFGDNNNDYGLIMAGAESYAVENAVEEIKKAAAYICPDYTKKGVYQILMKLIEENGYA